MTTRKQEFEALLDFAIESHCKKHGETGEVLAEQINVLITSAVSAATEIVGYDPPFSLDGVGEEPDLMVTISERVERYLMSQIAKAFEL